GSQHAVGPAGAEVDAPARRRERHAVSFDAGQREEACGRRPLPRCLQRPLFGELQRTTVGHVDSDRFHFIVLSYAEMAISIGAKIPARMLRFQETAAMLMPCSDAC